MKNEMEKESKQANKREQAINLIVDVVPIIHQNDNLLNILNLRFYFNLKLSSCYFSFLQFFSLLLLVCSLRRRIIPRNEIRESI